MILIKYSGLLLTSSPPRGASARPTLFSHEYKNSGEDRKVTRKSPKSKPVEVRVTHCGYIWRFVIVILGSVFLLPSVYVIIAIFCLASASALFSCLDAILDLIGCGTGRYEHHSLKTHTHTLDIVGGKYETDVCDIRPADAVIASQK